MKKLFGIVFVIFALSLVTVSLSSCKGSTPAPQNSTGNNNGGNNGNNNGGNNGTVSQIAGSEYVADRTVKGNVIKDAMLFRFVSATNWEFLDRDTGSTYQTVSKGTYVVQGNRIMLTITWSEDSEGVGGTLTADMSNNFQQLSVQELGLVLNKRK